MGWGVRYFGSTSANGSFIKDNSYKIELLPKALAAVKSNFAKADIPHNESKPMQTEVVPVEITESLRRFNDRYGKVKTCFIMMKYEGTPLQNNALSVIREELKAHGITGLIAKEKNWHDAVHYNIKTYMHGCTYGLAMYDRAVTEHFNPNVSFEVGYMMAIGKKICLLKDKTIPVMQTDLGGLTYRAFDIQQPIDSIKPEIKQWLEDIDHIMQTPLSPMDIALS